MLDSVEYMTIRVKKEFAFTFSTIVLERHFSGTEGLNQRLSAKIWCSRGLIFSPCRVTHGAA